jgi:hypothetical protein
MIRPARVTYRQVAINGVTQVFVHARGIPMSEVSDVIDQDREVHAMAMISQALQGLDEEAAVRVVRWATDRFRLQPRLWVE